MNNISIVGRVTKDIELSTTASGTKFVTFNVAVPSEFKTAEGERQADFFRCIAWRENAENIAKYFKKGSPIGLIGSMNSRLYQKKGGETQPIWELNVKNFYFVGITMEENEPKVKEKKSKTATQISITPVDDQDDNLPF